MSQLQQSFGRIVQIKVFATQIDIAGDGLPLISYNSGYTVFPSQFADGTPGFRITGKVNKLEAAVSVIPNPIQLAIYNLGAGSRALIESKVGTKIIVEAGYQNNPKLVFIGNILWARTHKEGPDYITQIQAGDGSFAVTNGQINTSFSGATTFMQVINTLVEALSMVGLVKGIIKGVPEGGYNNGIVLSGSPLELLQQTCQKLNLGVSIQNNQVMVLPVGEDLGSPVIEISPANGLIGIPEIRTQGLIGPVSDVNSTTPTNLMSFKCLLRPELEMYQKILMKSKFVNGTYVIARVTHDFDSWEGPFYTSCECASL